LTGGIDIVTGGFDGERGGRAATSRLRTHFSQNFIPIGCGSEKSFSKSHTL
jgi:hypothetical protein